MDIINIKEHDVTSSINTNWKVQYSNIKKKIDDLEKSNNKIVELYNTEEDRLKKSTLNYISIEQEREKNIKYLESVVMNLRKERENYKTLIKEKELLFQFLCNNNGKKLNLKK